MINFLRVFLAAFTVTLVAAAVALFFYTDRQHKTLDNTKTGAQTAFSNWETQSNCIEDPQSCLVYSGQFKNWMAQLEQYIESKEQKPQFQYYMFLKNIDAQYVADLNANGLASLGAASVMLLLFVFSIVYLMGGQKKTKASGIDTRAAITTPVRAVPRVRPDVRPPESKKIEPSPTQKIEAKAEPAKPPKTIKTAVPVDGNALLNKATDCAESEPMQAISYLEQALEGSLGSKLSLRALLLCGSLRLKNKIGEDRGREQLQQIISSEPESEDAAKAQTVLDTFK